MRHGQGFHNVAGLSDECEYLNPRWLDAHLTPAGFQQAAALRRHLRRLPALLPVEVVVTSPMTRALETATAAFGGGAWAAGGDTGPPLMTAQTEIPVRPCYLAYLPSAWLLSLHGLLGGHAAWHAPCRVQRPCRIATASPST